MGLTFEPQCRASGASRLELHGGLGGSPSNLSAGPVMSCGLNWGLGGLAFEPQCRACNVSWPELGVGWASL